MFENKEKLSETVYLNFRDPDNLTAQKINPSAKSHTYFFLSFFLFKLQVRETITVSELANVKDFRER